MSDNMARNAMVDALSGWKYIREHHGDLYGVGWDRVQDKLEAALAQPQNDQDKNVEDAVTSTIFLSLADKDIVKATDCRLVAKRLLSEVIASPPSSRMRRALEHIERVTHKVVPLLGASEGLASAVNERLEAIRTVASEALRAGDNHASDGKAPSQDYDPCGWKDKLPSDDLGASLERIRTEAARMGYFLVPMGQGDGQ